MKTKRQIIHKNELHSIDELFRLHENQIYNFLRLYFECELIVRRIIKSNLGDNTQNDFFTLNLIDIRKALHTIGVNFETKKLNMIFAKEISVNERSYRNLRNMIVHKMQKNAIKEVIKRYNMIVSDMVAFIEIFS